MALSLSFLSFCPVHKRKGHDREEFQTQEAMGGGVLGSDLVREYTMSGDYRKLMGRPADVEWELLRYKNPRADLQ
eukprot:2071073-Rhodomonas_salina.1